MKQANEATIYEMKFRRKYGYNEPLDWRLVLAVLAASTAFYFGWFNHCL